MTRFSPPIFLIGCLLLVAPASAPPGCPPAVLANGLRLVVEPREDHPLIADAIVALPRPAPVFLEYGNDEIGWLRTPVREAATAHEFPIVRLRQKTLYQARAFALDGAGCPAATATTEFESGELPFQLSRLSIRNAGQAGASLLLMDIRADDRTWLIGVESGHLVWYYPIPRQILIAQRRAHRVVQLRSGNLLYLVGDYGVEEITPDGRVVRRIRLREEQPHHDLLELPDGRILYLGEEERVINDTPNGGPPDLKVLGSTLHILDPQGEQREKVWSVFDTHDPLQRNPWFADQTTREPVEWTHANSISVGPRGNYIVSIRYLDQIISLSPDFKTVEWRLGGADSSFIFPDPTDRFFALHTASELPGGRIVLFDNGNFRPDGDYSRGLELELDFAEMTARRVWEYRHEPDVYSIRLGNAVRLPNGNTLVNFGFPPHPDDPVILVEARPDGTVAWEMALRLGNRPTTRYRVYPLTSLAGEQQVAPTVVAQGRKMKDES